MTDLMAMLRCLSMYSTSCTTRVLLLRFLALSSISVLIWANILLGFVYLVVWPMFFIEEAGDALDTAALSTLYCVVDKYQVSSVLMFHLKILLPTCIYFANILCCLPTCTLTILDFLHCNHKGFFK